MKYCVAVQNRVYEVEVREEDGCWRIFWNGKSVEVDCSLDRTKPFTSMIVDGRPFEMSVKKEAEIFSVDLGWEDFEVQVSRGSMRGSAGAAKKQGPQQEIVTAPMPGMVVTVKVKPNQEVDRGDPLLILEAMKMENELRSPVRARIHDVFVEKGRKVEKGEKLLILRM